MTETDLTYHYLKKNSLKPADLEFVRETRSHPSLQHHFLENRKITRSEQEYWYHNQYSPDKDWMIYLAKNESYRVGYVNFRVDSIFHQRCQVGFAVHPDFGETTYLREMIAWAVSFAGDASVKSMYFADEIHRLWSLTFQNTAHFDELIYAGFEIDGYLRDYARKDGEFQDVILLAYLF